ncbi:hypothetical protein RsTz2092_13580 [Deferribacterales bacterium RsTz2092]|nr:hypothetical protein AGMMS49941_12830 [Deferribacterales bacterium]
MSVECYNEITDKLELYKQLAAGLQDIREGRVVSLADVKTRLDRKYRTNLQTLSVE